MDPLSEIIARHAPVPELLDGCSSAVSDDGTISWSVQPDPAVVQGLVDEYIRAHAKELEHDRK